ncbi:MAG: hypothetical protein LBD23_02205 [Oscillospiraceae bacterium]|jgi:hypothetical protein|nr:hypothetical protein [Oscillospiraceae bacterium]
MEKENTLFRKSALDRISSPEQLNEYMKVAGPGVWVVLAGLVITFAAFFIWGVLGSIPETVDINGTVLSLRYNAAESDTATEIFCYLPIDEARQLKAGMAVRISPDWAPREKYGYIFGTVRSVGTSPVNIYSLRESLGTDFEFLSLPQGNLIEVIIKPETLDDGSLRWSTTQGASVNLTIGTTCDLTVITAQRKPYELMLRSGMENR